MYTFQLYNRDRLDGSITLELENLGKRSLQIRVLDGRFQGEIFEDWDYFSALKKLRIALENIDCLLGCTGSLINFYPFRMSLDMGFGEVGYLTTLGQMARRDNLARTFDVTKEVTALASVQEQFDFHEKWVSSLQGENTS